METTKLIHLILGMAPPAGEGGGGDMFTSFLPLIAIVAVIYVLMIRPEQKRRGEHKKFLEDLKRGDAVITGGGIIGKVSGLTDAIVTVEIAPKVHIKVQRAQIAGAAPADAGVATEPEPTGKGQKKKKK